jgi:hypothetical protein
VKIRYKNNGKGNSGFKIICPPLLLFPSYIPIWFSNSSSILLSISILLYNMDMKINMPFHVHVGMARGKNEVIIRKKVRWSMKRNILSWILSFLGKILKNSNWNYSRTSWPRKRLWIYGIYSNI